MKISIQKDVFIKAMSDVTKAISGKVSIPILSGVKITASTEGIFLICSNGNISIERTIFLEQGGEELASLLKDGSVVLNGNFLYEVVKKLPGKDILIEVDKNNVTKVSSGKSKFSLNGMPAEEYPNFPKIEGEADVVLSSADLSLLVKQTAFAVADSDARPLLTGVNLLLKDGLNVVSTDSHRLARKQMKISSKEDRQVTVPANALVELSKILENEPEEKIEVILADNQALFKTNNILFYSRLLEGNYPDTSKLIPSSFTTSLNIKVKTLLAALDRCSLIETNAKDKVVTMEVKDNKAILTVSSPEIGNIEEVLEDIEIAGEDIKLTFSIKFTKAALKAFMSEKVKFELTGPQRPFIITAENDPSLVQLILPVRTY
ncbi:DNA polymerase III subunit beta [Cytobacillus praedii]|uniref:DNA polymerase III subunit beta n=1 Tax=Cytobacillus praedii TaxID=1742358 RepID=UPI002E238F94|nr:DNA polymerase III subunit beta [Cytobacillus praedii]MED3554118.1 DNA polymerase III subunit beta [Cytobacillus praedii]